LLVLVTNPNSNFDITGITDSASNSYVLEEPDGSEPQVWYAANATTGPTLRVTLTTSGRPSQSTLVFYDITGAAVAPFDLVAGVTATNCSNLTSLTNSPSITPSTVNGLVLAALSLGQGPGLAVTSPSGASWDLVTYPPIETDMDLMENADGKAHLYNSTTATENWNWTITPIANDSYSASAVEFKAAVPAIMTQGPSVISPSMTSLSQTSGQLGTPATIAGADSGSTRGTSTVTFNGTVTNVAPTPGRVDFDGDGKTDITVYRPSTGTWEILKSRDNYTTSVEIPWGSSTDVPVPGDYDGDGKTDVAFYRPSTGQWQVLLSGTATPTSVTWGTSKDLPVPGDYDGDGKTDPATYDSATGQWQILQSSTSYMTNLTIALGGAGDIPVPGDYDGDGWTDPAVFHPATGEWRILLSSTNYAASLRIAWGTSTDRPVPADYDGDGKTDLGVYRPSTGTWYILQSGNNYTTSAIIASGGTAEVTIPGDYDGDGKADLALFQSGVWQVLLSSTNYATTMTVPWGLSTDVPVPTSVRQRTSETRH
jgi:hypothetical protein